MVSISVEESSQWHPGERAMHKLLRLPERDNPTTRLGPTPFSYGLRVTKSPLVAFGTLDGKGRVWRQAGNVDMRFDPVVRSLFAVSKNAEKGREEDEEGEIAEDEAVKREGGKVMAALSIDLETRDRVKLAGRMIGGAVPRTGFGTDAKGSRKGGGEDEAIGDLQMAFQVEELLGNCPKYLNKKRITPHRPAPRLATTGKGLPLLPEALQLIEKADLFFISSKYGSGSMDTNHRGGPPGFLRVYRNEAIGGSGSGQRQRGSVTLTYPEYSGNRFYQTLGNLHTDPYTGLAIPDFETGDVLYLTGRAKILIGDEATAHMPRTKLAVKIEVEEARFVRDGLPFRGTVVDYSPYNPTVRRLANEMRDSIVSSNGSGESGIGTATLVNRKPITPTISRYVFRLTPAVANDANSKTPKGILSWHAGQHVTLAFGPELDHGWSHMRDDDPQSLNDDFVRTFTVSSSVPLEEKSYRSEEEVDDGLGKKRGGDEAVEFEIIARRHGPVTGLLARWNLRVPLELPVLGFGGAESFRIPVARRRTDKVDTTLKMKGEEEPAQQNIFIAGGVGITLLMAQAAAVLESSEAREANEKSRLKLLWSIRAEDLPLTMEVLRDIRGLGKATRLFVTQGKGAVVKDGHTEKLISRIEKECDTQVVERRMDANDVVHEPDLTARDGRRFYCCTGPAMMKELLKWLEGEEMVFESFEY